MQADTETAIVVEPIRAKTGINAQNSPTVENIFNMPLSTEKKLQINCF